MYLNEAKIVLDSKPPVEAGPSPDQSIKNTSEVIGKATPSKQEENLPVTTLFSSVTLASSSTSDEPSSKSILNPAGARDDIGGNGTFRKQGQGYKNWKVRKYIISANRKLSYYSTRSACTDADMKGIINISSVRLTQGSFENIKSSGISKTEIEKAYALSLTCLEDSKTFELVFDSLAEIKHFLSLVGKISTVNNLPVRFENIFIYICILLIILLFI